MRQHKVVSYCVIQFYIQLRKKLSANSPFLKVLSIKLVIFLSFWQTIAISVGTSTLNIVHPNQILSYPDIKVGIPALLLCIEMAFFAVLHLWAFPYAPYVPGTTPAYYPFPDDRKDDVLPRENARQPPSGGFMGLKAFGDALNLWDFIRAFGSMRWLFCGMKRRTDDPSYENPQTNTMGMYGRASRQAPCSRSREDKGKFLWRSNREHAWRCIEHHSTLEFGRVIRPGPLGGKEHLPTEVPSKKISRAGVAHQFK